MADNKPLEPFFLVIITEAIDSILSSFYHFIFIPIQLKLILIHLKSFVLNSSNLHQIQLKLLVNNSHLSMLIASG